MDVKFFSICYCNQPEFGIKAKKTRLAMNWYSFLGQEYSFFNVIISCLIIMLKGIKKLKTFALWNPVKALPQILSCNYHCFAITLSLIKLNLLPQNRHWLKCLDKSLIWVCWNYILIPRNQSISCYLIKTHIIVILLYLEIPNTMYITYNDL